MVASSSEWTRSPWPSASWRAPRRASGVASVTTLTPTCRWKERGPSSLLSLLERAPVFPVHAFMLFAQGPIEFFEWREDRSRSRCLARSTGGDRCKPEQRGTLQPRRPYAPPRPQICRDRGQRGYSTQFDRRVDSVCKGLDQCLEDGC